MRSNTWRMFTLTILAYCVIPVAAAEAKPFKDVAELLDELDDNGDRKVSRQEFIGDFTGHARERAQWHFNSLDKNKDNELMLRELKTLLRRGRE